MNNRDRSKGQMMTFLNMLNFIAKNANFLILSIFAENRKDQKKSLKFLEVALEWCGRDTHIYNGLTALQKKWACSRKKRRFLENAYIFPNTTWRTKNWGKKTCSGKKRRFPENAFFSRTRPCFSFSRKRLFFPEYAFFFPNTLFSRIRLLSLVSCEINFILSIGLLDLSLYLHSGPQLINWVISDPEKSDPEKKNTGPGKKNHWAGKKPDPEKKKVGPGKKSEITIPPLRIRSRGRSLI